MNLLLLHGALGTTAQLEPLKQRVGGTAIHFTGHGTRAHEHASMSFDAFVSDIEEAYDANGWQRAHLFGYSMGGYAALLFAAKHPERVLSVVTLGTKYLWTPEGLQKELRMLNPDTMLAKVPAFADGLLRAHGAAHWRAVVDAVARNMKELAADPLLTKALLDRIVRPVLVCVGEQDTTAVPHDTRVFASALKHARVEVLPDARHPIDSVALDDLELRLATFWEPEE
ncbi:MAG: alpha/beta fold hydrolase [Flavobacteriales bacterium]|nr:MAG: alpha/beta fold hydrolase [Flavobacteriales bacterium]